MLRHTSDIKGYSIGAEDGQIGSVVDFLFDDRAWLVRWLVVDVGHILPGRKVLLPPMVLGHVNHVGRQFAVRLTMQEVKDSPDIDTDKSVSRQMEGRVYDYYGWNPYWNSGVYMGGYGFAGGLGASMMASPGYPDVDRNPEPVGDRHLRSDREVRGYHIHTAEGEIGHLADVLVDDTDWSLRYLVVDTGNWWPGRKVLVSSTAVRSVDWTDRLVNLTVSRQAVKDSPAYDGSEATDRAFEDRFHDYYGRVGKPERVEKVAPPTS
jgi:hypothetical protein